MDQAPSEVAVLDGFCAAAILDRLEREHRAEVAVHPSR
jgi:hypothetical protein